MAVIAIPKQTRTEPYKQSRWRCLNKNCRGRGRNHTGRDHRCGRCNSHTEATEVVLVIPKILKCRYCKQSNCQHLQKTL